MSQAPRQQPPKRIIIIINNNIIIINITTISLISPPTSSQTTTTTASKPPPKTQPFASTHNTATHQDPSDLNASYGPQPAEPHHELLRPPRDPVGRACRVDPRGGGDGVAHTQHDAARSAWQRREREKIDHPDQKHMRIVDSRLNAREHGVENTGARAQRSSTKKAENKRG